MRRNSSPASLRKIKTLAQMAATRRRLRSLGLRVVVTNGVFDVLHYGHVTYLQKARAFGDVLVVGLNSDASVRTLKGPSRPIVPQRERAAVLAALACVDYVVIFDELRATKLLAALKPDVYVKGGDYNLATLDQDERRAVERAGGKIMILPMVPGRSTTNIIKTILKRFGTAGC